MSRELIMFLLNTLVLVLISASFVIGIYRPNPYRIGRWLLRANMAMWVVIWIIGLTKLLHR
jgi:hypothetical protein